MNQTLPLQVFCAPLIRWAGSKRRLISELELSVPNSFDRYVEPFFGSGCLFFKLMPKKAVLGDLNEDLMSFYRQIRRFPEDVRASAIRFRRGKEDYYRLRSAILAEPNAKKRAALFFYLNRFCFNGIYRTNRKGHFNVPMGSRTGTFPSIDVTKMAAAQLKRAKLVCGDFVHTMNLVEKGDFVYLDPPYAYQNHRNRGEYGEGSFSINDLARLEVALAAIDRIGAKFLLSYAECPEIQKIQSLYKTRTVQVNRCISVQAEGRRLVNEVLVSNYSA